jgi:hypothetical protein
MIFFTTTLVYDKIYTKSINNFFMFLSCSEECWFSHEGKLITTQSVL